LQKPDISIDEGAVIFILAQVESCIIGCSHFGWSFHDWFLFFLDFVRGMRAGG
jgi:hypothetical protein